MSVVESHPKVPKRGASRFRLQATFDGINRRMDQFQRTLFIDGSSPAKTDSNRMTLKAMGEDREAFVAAGLGHWKETHVRSAHDGVQFMRYAEGLGASVKDPSDGSVDYIFDPRTLGISTQYLMTYTLSTELGYSDAQSVSLLGYEEINGHQTWHVCVLGKNEEYRHFWVENSANFEVRRCEERSQFSKEIVTSRYDHKNRLGMPSLVELREYDKAGVLDRIVTITIEKSEYNVSIDPKDWTLAGLGMPSGEMVMDERINRVIGHFDGEGVTPSVVDAIRKGKDAQWRPLHWGMAFTGLIALAVLAAFLVHRRNLLRREA